MSSKANDIFIACGAVMECSLGSQKAKLKVPTTRVCHFMSRHSANSTDTTPECNLIFPPCKKGGNCLTAKKTPWNDTKKDVLIDGYPAVLYKKSWCGCIVGGIITFVDNGNECGHNHGQDIPCNHMEGIEYEEIKKENNIHLENEADGVEEEPVGTNEQDHIEDVSREFLRESSNTHGNAIEELIMKAKEEKERELTHDEIDEIVSDYVDKNKEDFDKQIKGPKDGPTGNITLNNQATRERNKAAKIYNDGVKAGKKYKQTYNEYLDQQEEKQREKHRDAAKKHISDIFKARNTSVEPEVTTDYSYLKIDKPKEEDYAKLNEFQKKHQGATPEEVAKNFGLSQMGTWDSNGNFLPGNSIKNIERKAP